MFGFILFLEEHSTTMQIRCLRLEQQYMVISVEEFMNATEGFTKMDRKTLFELVDRNGKIDFSAMKRFHLCSFMF